MQVVSATSGEICNPPPPRAIFVKKWVNQGFENVFVRTPPILGALNPKNMPLESKDLLFG